MRSCSRSSHLLTQTTNENGELKRDTERSVADDRRTALVPLPIGRDQETAVRSFDETGRIAHETDDAEARDGAVSVPVEPGGFSVVQAPGETPSNTERS